MGDEKTLTLTKAQVDVIADAIHKNYPNYDVNDILCSLAHTGLTINDAKELDNGELVFSLGLRLIKDANNI